MGSLIRWLFFILTLSTAVPSMAQFKLPSLFSDHMVLQKSQAAPVWGKDQPGQGITVSIAGQSVTAQTGPDGKWKVLLPSLEAGGPYSLLVSGSQSVTIQDVLVGEVWVASGQSNMELPLNNTNGGEQEALRADQPQIRWFVQERRLSDKPLDEPKGSWQICSPDTAKGFSAAAYYFGKKLHRSLGVPVGIIGTYWGGTWIESWIPQETFQTHPSIKPILNRWESFSPAEKEKHGGLQDSEMDLWGLRLMPKDHSQAPVTISLKADDNTPASLGGNWTDNAQPGSVITLTAGDGGGPKPGPVASLKASIQVGGWGNWNTSFAPDGKPVDLRAFEAVEFYAKGRGKFSVLLSQPIIADWDNYGSQPFELTDQWKPYRVSFDELKQSGWGLPKPFVPSALQGIFINANVDSFTSPIPTALFNGMVHPLIPFGIKGVLWYQGETNVGHAGEYGNLLPALIEGWRNAWGQGDFPFIYAQLPNYLPVKPDPSESDWAELRESQLRALEEPQTGMAVLIDLGEADDIHPKDKADVGDRLALAALHVAYDNPGPFSGPIYDSMTVEDNRVRLKFKEAEEGLMIKGGGDLKGFAIAGADGKFQWANAKIDGLDVVVWNDQIQNPQAVRYAWADNPVCNLWGKNGLPASPFRTDDLAPGK